MHIMEGFLPPLWCLFWYILMIPVVAWGLIQIKRTFEKTPESKALLAVSGAFMFVLSSLKMPSVTGSCSMWEWIRSSTIRTSSNKCTRSNRTTFPSYHLSTWRINNFRGKLFLNGNSRTIRSMGSI